MLFPLHITIFLLRPLSTKPLAANGIIYVLPNLPYWTNPSTPISNDGSPTCCQVLSQEVYLEPGSSLTPGWTKTCPISPILGLLPNPRSPTTNPRASGSSPRRDGRKLSRISRCVQTSPVSLLFTDFVAAHHPQKPFRSPRFPSYRSYLYRGCSWIGGQSVSRSQRSQPGRRSL